MDRYYNLNEQLGTFSATKYLNVDIFSCFSVLCIVPKEQLFSMLICSGSTSYTRRSCQTVLSAHLLSIVRVIAPILPHLAEDVWQNLPFQYITEYGSAAEYVFESRWPTLNERWLALPAEEINFWEKILEVVSVLLMSSESMSCCQKYKPIHFLSFSRYIKLNRNFQEAQFVMIFLLRSA